MALGRRGPRPASGFWSPCTRTASPHPACSASRSMDAGSCLGDPVAYPYPVARRYCRARQPGSPPRCRRATGNRKCGRTPAALQSGPEPDRGGPCKAQDVGARSRQPVDCHRPAPHRIHCFNSSSPPGAPTASVTPDNQTRRCYVPTRGRRGAELAGGGNALNTTLPNPPALAPACRHARRGEHADRQPEVRAAVPTRSASMALLRKFNTSCAGLSRMASSTETKS